jgi:hypothetical protein
MGSLIASVQRSLSQGYRRNHVAYPSRSAGVKPFFADWAGAIRTDISQRTIRGDGKMLADSQMLSLAAAV